MRTPAPAFCRPPSGALGVHRLLPFPLPELVQGHLKKLAADIACARRVLEHDTSSEAVADYDAAVERHDHYLDSVRDTLGVDVERRWYVSEQPPIAKHNRRAA